MSSLQSEIFEVLRIIYFASF